MKGIAKFSKRFKNIFIKDISPKPWRNPYESDEELNQVNQICADEFFRHGGENLRQSFYRQELGSYWLIEFRETIAFLLRSQGSTTARKFARSEITKYF